MPKVYKPNKISLRERVIYIALSVAIVGYGSYGLAHDDTYLPSKRGGLHFHGKPAWFLYASFLCVAANLAAMVADHYDRRNNERGYKAFARITEALAFCLFISCLVFEAFVFKNAT